MSRLKAIQYLEDKLKKHRKKRNKKKAARKQEMLNQLKAYKSKDYKKKYEKLLHKYKALEKEHQKLLAKGGKRAIVSKNGAPEKAKSSKKAPSKGKQSPKEPIVTILPSPKPKESEDSVLARIKGKAAQVNFEKIGKATIKDKDDLKRIKGIGPMIESRLNALGIYTFTQISKFSPKDEVVVNEAIEYFQGRISRDNWVEQALAFIELDKV